MFSKYVNGAGAINKFCNFQAANMRLFQ